MMPPGGQELVTLIHSEKQRVGKGEKNPVKGVHIMLVPLATLINKRYNPKHVEFYQVYQNHWQQLAAVAPSCLLCFSHAGQNY